MTRDIEKKLITGVLFLLMILAGSGNTVAAQPTDLNATAGISSNFVTVADNNISLDDERPIAFVRRFKPKVSIFNRNVGKVLLADEKGEKLYDGDTLATGENGYAAVQFMDNSLAKVKPESLLLIRGKVDNEKQSISTRILLNAGELIMSVNEQKDSDFEVATETSVATVKGTIFGSLVESDGETFHYVLDGTVQVTSTGSGQSVTIGQGEFARIGPDGESIETGELENGEMKRRREEFDQMDDKMEPKKLKLQFENESGQGYEIELDYYENEEEN